VAEAPGGTEIWTERLRLTPIGPEHAAELVTIHRDPWIARWYGGEWSTATAETFAMASARAWRADGVAKWIAFDRRTAAVVGRGGLSRMPPNDTTAQIAALAGPGWTEQCLELGWAVREAFRGKGLATEIGAAGLSFATDILKASSVIAFTERHNIASRHVMHRLGMQLLGEIRATGLIEGKSGEHDNAPFALYVIER
jgi:RimJ/RimL family protein N-acetyltransferase